MDKIRPDDTGRQELGVYGRRVTIPSAKGQACRFTFSDLCEQVSTFSCLNDTVCTLSDY